MKSLMSLVLFVSVTYTCYSFHVSSIPCNVTFAESCPAILYYVPNATKTLEETAALFNVNSNAVNRTINGFLITIKCSCQAQLGGFTWQMVYEVQPGDTWRSVSSKFGFLVVEKPEKILVPFRIVTLDFFCGCAALGAEVLTYRVVTGDTLYTICSRFDADMNKTAMLNRLANSGLIHDGDVMFIPEPRFQNLSMVDNKDLKKKKASKSHIPIVTVAILAALSIILLTVLLVSWNHNKSKGILRSTREEKRLQCHLDSSPQHMKFEESLVSSLNSEKATVFPYHEVRDATGNFSHSLKIGQGSYGSVYFGKLKEKEVAIKQMKNSKSKEFLAELKILCKVNHPNVIELIGYAAGGEFLFLVYEYARNGALSDHLHRRHMRGCQPLPWSTRVRIALDAAKGLEYIHKHTRPYYVHRDVKTSNILLDSNFHAKIADFGLVKLLEHSPDDGAAASRIVGTFGYLAPEYVRDGLVTSKSDVYAFGIVLMELLTSQPALRRDASPGMNDYSEHRSLVDYMLSALSDTRNAMTAVAKCIDPNIRHYHNDSALQMALLAKDCVKDNWNQRPDMSRVVQQLSHILICSEDWDTKHEVKS